MMNKNMKKDNKGFSLVELIIVIAIMAILIGVVALQVIPYLEKSRVGKDKQTVDTVYSSFQSAIAATDGAGAADISFEITSGSSASLTVTCTDAGVQAGVKKDMEATLGNAASMTGKLSSKPAKGQSIKGEYTKSDKKIIVYVDGCKDGATNNTTNEDGVVIQSSNQ